MNYLVIDLEMCKVPKHYRTPKYKYANETIQVGAVLLNDAYEKIATINQYVHPEHGVIDYFISELTGIKNFQLKHAPCLEEALKHMLNWIGEREYKVFAWSNSDYHQLAHEIKGKEIVDDKIKSFMDSERWIDYQAVFGKRFHYTRAVALDEALASCDIDLEGRQHDGLDDAINTAKLIKKLEENQEFTPRNLESDIKMESASLNFCLGDLFAGLNIEYPV